MTTFIRGLQPKVAMDIGWQCKKHYEDKICSKCFNGVFDWRPDVPMTNLNRNYCKLNYWGVSPEKDLQIL